jgi:GTPase SAR1 family protein
MKLLNDSGLTNLDVVIVGNKCDLDHMRIVPHDLPEALAYELSYTHILTSSINGTNVKKVFYKIAESLIHSYNIFIPGIEAEAVFNGALSQSEDANTRSIILSRQEYIETSERIKKQKKSCCTKH